MRALLVHNPNATTTTPTVTDAIATALSTQLKLDVEGTKRRDHAGFLAAGAVHEGYDVVVALGGDGTINEVVQGIARTPVRLAVLPGGSTNVFARVLGLPTDPLEAAARALRRLREHQDRTITLGRANGRWFTFCSGWGYDAEVVRMVDRRPRLKAAGRQATFLWCGLLAQLQGAGRAARVTLHSGEDAPVEGLRTVVCCNANPYTYLGPLSSQMCPEAALERGLDVTALERARFLDLARVSATALHGRRVPRLPRVRTWHDRDDYILRASAPLPLHVDGEFVEETEALRLTGVPHALRVVA